MKRFDQQYVKRGLRIDRILINIMIAQTFYKKLYWYTVNYVTESDKYYI